MIEWYTIHFTVGSSSFVDVASSRQIAVVNIYVDSERPAEPHTSIKFLLDKKNNEKK